MNSLPALSYAPLAGFMGAADPRLEQIRQRMEINLGPGVSYDLVWGLSDLYDWLMLEKNVPPHELGKADDMFWALLEWGPQGMTRLQAAAFLNAKYEIDKNLLPDPSMTWWERIQEGAKGIIEAPATIINQATAPLSEDFKTGLKYAAIGLGGLGVLALALRFSK